MFRSARNFARRTLTRFPLSSILLGTLTGIIAADWISPNWKYPPAWPLSLVLLTLTAAPLLLHRRQSSPLASPALFAIALSLGFIHHSHTLGRQQQWLENWSPNSQAYAQLSGVIIDSGPQANGPYLIEMAAQNGLPGGVRLLLRDPNRLSPGLTYGSRVRFEGNLGPIPAPRNPHGFDQQAWRHRQGADLQCSTRNKVIPIGPSPRHQLFATLLEWKHVLRNQITAGLDPQSNQARLIRAVVLGEKPPRDSGLVDDFRYSGTLHVFAVSGLHVGMIGTIIALLFWFSRAPRSAIILFTLAGMTLYAGITGMRPPAVRAVIMAAVFLSGFLVRRRPSLINSLGASAIIVLLYDSHQLFTPGFQLSYGVLLAIALLSGVWNRVYQPIASIDPFLPRSLLTNWQMRRLQWREKLQTSLAVSTSAWFGASPLIWIHFGLITPISIIASLPLVLLVFGILSLAMLSLATSTVSPGASHHINQLNSLAATLTQHCASSFAALPGSHFSRPPDHPESGRIIVFDLPDGGACQLIQLGGNVLLDSGRSHHFRYQVQPALDHIRATPDTLILSHADAQHIAAMPRCLELYQPKQALIPRADQRSPSFKRFLQDAQKHACRVITPSTLQTFPLSHSHPDRQLEILQAPASLDGYGQADDSGLVIRLHWDGWRILFTADAGWITEAHLLNSGIDLSADLIVMGRHRNDLCGQLPFIDAVKPRAIISSNAPFPHHERIPDQWKRQLQQRGITLIDQQQTGAVTLTLEDKQLVLKPTRPNNKPLRLSPAQP